MQVNSHRMRSGMVRGDVTRRRERARGAAVDRSAAACRYSNDRAGARQGPPPSLRKRTRKSVPHAGKCMTPSTTHAADFRWAGRRRWLVGAEAAEPSCAAVRRHPTCRPPRSSDCAGSCRGNGRTWCWSWWRCDGGPGQSSRAAERMFFTPLGLEQATDEMVAGLQGPPFRRRRRRCSISARASAAIWLRWPAWAEHRLRSRPEDGGAGRGQRPSCCGRRRHGQRGVMPDVEIAKSATVDVGGARAWHIDPDRRPSGRRTTRVELHEPGVEVIEAMLAQNSNAAIKLAPPPHCSNPGLKRAELEWISRGRECRQLVAWFGELRTCRTAPRDRARHGTVPPRSMVGVPRRAAGRGACRPVSVRARRCRAGRQAGRTLAAEHGLRPIASGVAYWTADRTGRRRGAGCFEVGDVLPFHIKTLKALCAAAASAAWRSRNGASKITPNNCAGN